VPLKDLERFNNERALLRMRDKLAGRYR
jgi:hypothetical protein